MSATAGTGRNAIDKYFRDEVVKRTNTKGLRPAEQRIISQIEEDRRNFYAQNREALKRNDLNALERFNRFSSDIQDVAAGGLEVTDRLSKIYPAIQKEKYGVTDKFLKEVFPLMGNPRYKYENGQLVENDKFKLLDVTDIEANAKPWDIEDDAKIRNYLTVGLAPKQIGEPIKKTWKDDPRKEYTVTNFDLTPEMKREFEQRAYNAYNDNDRLRKK